MNNRFNIAFEFIENSFSNEVTILHYENAITRVGLWDSEKTILLHYFNLSDKILIAGCGAGRVPFGLHTIGFQSLYGVDISKLMIQKALYYSKTHNIDMSFCVGNIVNMPYDNSFFNGVFMPYNVLMHIPSYSNRLKSLLEVKRILLPNSYFIFTTHNDRNASLEWLNYWNEEKIKWDNGLYDSRLFEYGDRIVADKGSSIFMHFPTNDEVVQLIKDADFNLVETKLRSEICNEPENVSNFSLDCRFWVVQN